MSKHAVMPLTDYVRTCNAIREKNITNEPIKSGELPEKINDVYDAGHQLGYSRGYDDGMSSGYGSGFEDGKTAEWNELWDGIQSMGARTDYRRFCYSTQFIIDRDTTPRWNFKPKYDIKPSTAFEMFRQFNSGSSAGVRYESIRIDLTQWLKDLGVTLDTSNCTDAQSMLYNCQGIWRMPFLDFSKCTGANTLANFCGQSAVLTTIDGIKSSENTAWDSRSFTNNNAVSHCIFSGVIAKSFYVNNLIKLDKESIISVVNTLSKTTSGLTATISKTAVINAFGSTESDEWVNLINTKPNWSISLT